MDTFLLELGNLLLNMIGGYKNKRKGIQFDWWRCKNKMTRKLTAKNVRSLLDGAKQLCWRLGTGNGLGHVLGLSSTMKTYLEFMMTDSMQSAWLFAWLVQVQLLSCISKQQGELRFCQVNAHGMQKKVQSVVESVFS